MQQVWLEALDIDVDAENAKQQARVNQEQANNDDMTRKKCCLLDDGTSLSPSPRRWNREALGEQRMNLGSTFVAATSLHCPLDLRLSIRTRTSVSTTVAAAAAA